MAWPAASLLAASIVMSTMGWGMVAATAEMPAVALRRHHEKKIFTDEEIIDGFMKTAFGAEYHLAGRIDRIRKYQKPIRVFITGVASPERIREVRDVTADIGKHINHLDIAVTPHREDANVIVRLVRDRDLYKEIRKLYGVANASAIRRSLNPQCLSGFRKNDKYEIEHSEVILTVDSGDFVFLDCAYEELLQSLGPINDTNSVPWTMFNDNVSMGFFDTYNRYLLNILYDPRIKAGMSVEDVRPLLPAVLQDVRAGIAEGSDLRP